MAPLRGSLMAELFTSVLEVRNLAKAYGKKEVVKDVSFSMQSGQIIGLLGPNGAGKTTTFYMIVGFLKAKMGTILLNGEDITELPMYQRSKRGLSYLPQEPSIFRKLSVEDNIRLVAQTRRDLSHAQQEDRVNELLSEFGIDQVRKQKGYTLSGGSVGELKLPVHWLPIPSSSCWTNPLPVSIRKQCMRSRPSSEFLQLGASGYCLPTTMYAIPFQ